MTEHVDLTGFAEDFHQWYSMRILSNQPERLLQPEAGIADPQTWEAEGYVLDVTTIEDERGERGTPTSMTSIARYLRTQKLPWAGSFAIQIQPTGRWLIFTWESAWRWVTFVLKSADCLPE